MLSILQPKVCDTARQEVQSLHNPEKPQHATLLLVSALHPIPLSFFKSVCYKLANPNQHTLVSGVSTFFGLGATLKVWNYSGGRVMRINLAYLCATSQKHCGAR